MKACMKRTAHLVAGTLLIVALVPLGLAVSVGSASAASCSGYSCHGLDPSGRCTDTTSTCTPVNTNNTIENVAVLYNKYSKDSAIPCAEFCL